MAAKKARKAAAAKPAVGGRPTKYRPAYAEQARRLALLGLTDAEMADFFGIAESTLHLWKKQHPGFSESILAGKERADADIAGSLYRTALGGSTVLEVREKTDAEGKIVRETVTRELPADVRAQRYWLGNRQPQRWRDKVVVEDATPPEVLAQTAQRFAEIMAAARERQQQVLIERGIADSDGA